MNVDYHHYPSIAIVDDEEDIVTQFTEVYIENWCPVLGFFTNSLLTFDYISERTDKFSLIIVDYKMSPMQGSELSNKISTINTKIGLILITAYDIII